MKQRCVEFWICSDCCPGTTAQPPEGLENLHLFQGKKFIIHLIFQEHGILQVDVWHLLLHGEASQLKSKFKDPAETERRILCCENMLSSRTRHWEMREGNTGGPK